MMAQAMHDTGLGPKPPRQRRRDGLQPSERRSVQRRRRRWRPADEDLFGEGCSPPDDVRVRMDAAAYVEFYFEAMTDEAHPGGWWHALIWNEA